MTDSTGDGIRVRVVFQAGLKRYGGGERERDVSLPAGATLNDLVGALGMSDEDVWVVGVNGVLATRETVLGDRDEVEFFEPIAGG
jgi:sulfur carrier protein ThiS